MQANNTRDIGSAATEIVRRQLKRVADAEESLQAMARIARHHAEVTEKLLRSEQDVLMEGVALVPRLEYHLLADSIRRWFVEQVFNGESESALMGELAAVALDAVDWMRFAEEQFRLASTGSGSQVTTVAKAA